MSGYNPDRAISSVPIDTIHTGERARSLCETAVETLAESIKAIGLQTPISLIAEPNGRDERYVLVAGLHRLEAHRRLGKSRIDARIIDLDETDRQLWEIAENLHRAELTPLERSEYIDQWIKLSKERAEAKAQLEPSGRSHTGGRPDQGINAAVRELGIERNEAQRAAKVAGLAPEAKAEARAQGLDDNQSALLKAAKYASKEEQIHALREAAARKAAGRNNASPSKARIEAVVNAVKRLSQDELAAFAHWFDTFRAERTESETSEDGVDDARAKNSTQPGWTKRI